MSEIDKEFDKAIRDVTARHHLWRVFSDFCEMAAISMGNLFVKDPEQEERYNQIWTKYDASEQDKFPKLLSLTIKGVEDIDHDFLGEAFMRLELSSHWSGQFFTPMSLAKLNAAVIIGDEMPEKGYFTIHDPAVGAGAMVFGFAAVMREKGWSDQQQLHATCIDIDPTAANMCFIQLALRHIPAIVYTGDTLAMKMQSYRLTPAHVLGKWTERLDRDGEKEENTKADIELPSQPTLFE